MKWKERKWFDSSIQFDKKNNSIMNFHLYNQVTFLTFHPHHLCCIIWISKTIKVNVFLMTCIKCDKIAISDRMGHFSAFTSIPFNKKHSHRTYTKHFPVFFMVSNRKLLFESELNEKLSDWNKNWLLHPIEYIEEGRWIW